MGRKRKEKCRREREDEEQNDNKWVDKHIKKIKARIKERKTQN